MRKARRAQSAPGPVGPPDRLLRWWPEEDYRGLSPWEAFTEWRAEQRAWAGAPGRDGDLTEDVDGVMLFRWWHRVRRGLPLWDAAEVQQLAARGKRPPFWPPPSGRRCSPPVAPPGDAVAEHRRRFEREAARVYAVNPWAVWRITGDGRTEAERRADRATQFVCEEVWPEGEDPAAPDAGPGQ